MGIWIELGVFVLALAFGLWQIHDVKKAREKTAQQRAQDRGAGAADQAAKDLAAPVTGGPGQASGPGQSGATARPGVNPPQN